MPHKIPFVEAALSRANTLEKQGEFAQAEAVYLAILENFPSDKRVIRHLKAVREMRTGQGEGRVARPGQAQIDELVALYRQGRLQEALAKTLALSEQYPDLALLHNILGAVNSRLVRWPEAIACYQKALFLKPDYAEAHNNLGNTFSRLGRYQEAIDSFQQALHIKPDYAEAYNGLGSVLHKLGRYEEAIASYRKVLEIVPGYAEAHNNLGNALYDLGRYDEAGASYAEALRLQPDFPEAHYNLSLVNTYTPGDPQLARRWQARDPGKNPDSGAA